jgi:hypothetical protein
MEDKDFHHPLFNDVNPKPASQKPWKVLWNKLKLDLIQTAVQASYNELESGVKKLQRPEGFQHYKL